MKKLKTVGAYVIAQRSRREMVSEEYEFVAVTKEDWNEGLRDADFEADSSEELEDWAIPEESKLQQAKDAKDKMDQEEWEEFVTDELDIRVCSHCGQPMDEGYIVDEGYSYYCKDECILNVYNGEEMDEMYADDTLYWTEWK